MKLSDIKYKLFDMKETYRENKENRKCLMKYPDYEANEYNCGSLKFIWGVTSYDNLTGSDASLYSMNDIDITYDRETKKYMLGIETAYMFEGNRKREECRYLTQLLEVFTNYMDKNGYDKNYDYCLFMTSPATSYEADSIEELYMNFKIFVEGYCSAYEYKCA